MSQKIHLTHFPKTNHKSKNGFTLIELSIVIVIIGLLVGGVMVGKDLIASSAIRAQIKQIDELKSAVNDFKLKYGYLPGDIPPTQTSQLGFFTFTGLYAGKVYLLFQSASTGSYKYAFGNNNGEIEYSESYVLWQHLSQAKMIKGTYGGSVSAGNYLVTTADNSFVGGMPFISPSTQADLEMFLPSSKFSHTDDTIGIEPNHYFTKAKVFDNTTLLNYFYFFITPNQGYAIDSKVDDGFPESGTVRAGEVSGSLPCLAGSSPNTYNLLKATADIPDDCYINILW